MIDCQSSSAKIKNLKRRAMLFKILNQKKIENWSKLKGALRVTTMGAGTYRKTHLANWHKESIGLQGTYLLYKLGKLPFYWKGKRHFLWHNPNPGRNWWLYYQRFFSVIPKWYLYQSIHMVSEAVINISWTEFILFNLF